MKSNLKFHIKTALFQAVIYGSMFALSFTNYVSDEYKHIMPVLSVVFGCIGIGVLSVYPFCVEFKKRDK